MRAARPTVAALLTALFLVPATPARADPASGSSSDCAPAGRSIVAEPWPQTMLDPQRAWPFATGRGVTVAVLDSGVDAHQPGLHGRVGAGADFLHGKGNRSGDSDCVGHGTEVGGIIAAQRADSIGFAGIAPGAKLLPVTVSEKEVMSDGDTSGDTVDAAGLAAAVRWAVDAGADVLNMSLVLYDDDPRLRAAIGYAQGKGVVVVAAVGNEGARDAKNREPYPASYDGVIGVGAVDSNGFRADSSQHGSYVDVVAPGVQVVTTARHSGQVRVDGTSFATPFVSGVAALVRQRYPRLTPAQVATRIMATANPASGGTDSYGHGIVDPYRAVTEPLSTTSPQALPALAKNSSRPLAAANATQRHRATRLAVTLSVVVLLVAAGMLLVAAVARQGRRRGWSPLLPAPSLRGDAPAPSPTGVSPFALPAASEPGPAEPSASP